MSGHDAEVAECTDESFIVEALSGTAQLFHSERQGTVGVFGKSDPKDIVTSVDLAIETYLIDLIVRSYPHDEIFSEEAGRVGSNGDACWIIDPLDGTTNFAAGLPTCGTMIARLVGGVPRVAGMVVYPDNRIYSATRGRGARMNGRTLALDLCSSADGLVDFGIFRTASSETNTLAGSLLQEILRETGGVRMTGSLGAFDAVLRNQMGAAMSLSFHLWDVVAPWLIFQEAGGSIATLDGRRTTGFDIGNSESGEAGLFSFVFSRFTDTDEFADMLRQVVVPDNQQSR